MPKSQKPMGSEEQPCRSALWPGYITRIPTTLSAFKRIHKNHRIIYESKFAVMNLISYNKQTENLSSTSFLLPFINISCVLGIFADAEKADMRNMNTSGTRH
jgi:hypothetical protein